MGSFNYPAQEKFGKAVQYQNDLGSPFISCGVDVIHNTVRCRADMK